MFRPAQHLIRIALATLGVAAAVFGPAKADDFSEPWKQPDRALVIDAYEYNSIDWEKLVLDRRIAGFINKASDGLSPAYYCSGDETQVRLCKALWKRHAVARELFQTRRMMAKALGLKWGAYHLARPGNPIEQADNFVDFADPAPDDLMAIDIEDNDPSQWMSLDDAELFVRHVRARTGRYPVLYTNDNTAEHIAASRKRYPLLSRLPLWYARYKPDIGLHFPKGYWPGYTLWQFAAQANCDAQACPYRVPGTPEDIDVNVASMSADELRAEWPFGDLVDAVEIKVARIPVPISRAAALAGEYELQYARVEEAFTEDAVIQVASAAEPTAFAALFTRKSGDKKPVRVSLHKPAEPLDDLEYESYLKNMARTRKLAEAIQASYASVIVTRSVLRMDAKAEPPLRFSRYNLPVFLLKEPDLGVLKDFKNPL